MKLHLPDDWNEALATDIESDYFSNLMRFVAAERNAHDIYPPEEHQFHALHLTPLATVRVVIIGQDPYHNQGQAHGLCFSVPEGVKKPPSLVNITRELATDVGCVESRTGCLAQWAQQGVLLLNSVLTVRAHEPNSHRGRGWERFTDSIIRSVNDNAASCVFILWGASAQRRSALVDPEKHSIIASPHPSPLSAYSGFFGSKPFTRANAALAAAGRPAIEWPLRDS